LEATAHATTRALCAPRLLLCRLLLLAVGCYCRLRRILLLLLRLLPILLGLVLRLVLLGLRCLRLE
jgi:hypothetical protein